MRVKNMLASALILLLPSAVMGYQKSDEEIERRKKELANKDKKYSVVDESLNKYNTTMREKDFWTCAHGYWGTYKFCGFDVDNNKMTVEDMCVHRPRWACDPMRCTWETDREEMAGGFCRIKCKMSRNDINVVKHDMERRNNYCPKGRCVWKIPTGGTLADGACDLDDFNLDQNGEKRDPEKIITKDLLFKKAFEGSEGDVGEELGLKHDIIWQKCAILSFFGSCRHYLKYPARKKFGRDCQLQTEHIKTRSEAKSINVDDVLAEYAGKYNDGSLTCDDRLDQDVIMGRTDAVGLYPTVALLLVALRTLF